jgi:hypothetical protein
LVLPCKSNLPRRSRSNQSAARRTRRGRAPSSTRLDGEADLVIRARSDDILGRICKALKLSAK